MALFKAGAALVRSRALSSAAVWRTAAAVGSSYSTLSKETLRIACSSGFWGDTAVAAPQLVHHGNIDFLVADYLSEITMSLLTAAKQKSPEFGYAPDFVQTLKPLVRDIKQKGIRVVANAGGVNPEACSAAITKICRDEGVELSVATVTGDNLMSKIKDICALDVRDMDTGISLPKSVHSLNAYLGAFPIAEALNRGADVVVTGRCVDSALALGPLIHKFGWNAMDYDLLAAGSLAGHLIECGAQATGGTFTDWDKVQGWDTMGFPIVECDADGKFVVTKPPNTGGLVSTATVAEQLVYEIGDPCNYLLPDVTCDFSNVIITEQKDTEGATVALVTGAKGKPPSDALKVSGTYADGFKAIAVCPAVGPRAGDKARRQAAAILNRTRAMFKQVGLQDYTDTNVHIIGSEESYGDAARSLGSREVVLWLAVKHSQKVALEIFAREIAPGGTGMAPGMTTLVGGRPRVSPVLRLFSFLHPKKDLPISLSLDGATPSQLPLSAPTAAAPKPQDATADTEATVGDGALMSGSHSYRVGDLAYLRSGDKGDSSNIGVIARHPSYLPYLKQALTVTAIGGYFDHLMSDHTDIQRYHLPGIAALNFVLKNSLGGGGVASLRIDPQGKGYAQMLADFKVHNMPNLQDLADRAQS